jgi:hypothetical protein
MVKYFPVDDELPVELVDVVDNWMLFISSTRIHPLEINLFPDVLLRLVSESFRVAEVPCEVENKRASAVAARDLNLHVSNLTEIEPAVLKLSGVRFVFMNILEAYTRFQVLEVDLFPVLPDGLDQFLPMSVLRSHPLPIY